MHLSVVSRERVGRYDVGVKSEANDVTGAVFHGCRESGRQAAECWWGGFWGRPPRTILKRETWEASVRERIVPLTSLNTTKSDMQVTEVYRGKGDYRLLSEYWNANNEKHLINSI